MTFSELCEISIDLTTRSHRNRPRDIMVLTGQDQAASGHNRTVTRPERETLKGPLHSETCRKRNSTYSAKADFY